MIVLKHGEAFQPLLETASGFIQLAGGSYVQEGTEPVMGFWGAFGKAFGDGAFTNKAVFTDLCNVILQIFNRDAKVKGLTNMKYSDAFDDFVATLSSFSPRCSAIFVRTLGTYKHTSDAS